MCMCMWAYPSSASLESPANEPLNESEPAKEVSDERGSAAVAWEHRTARRSRS